MKPTSTVLVFALIACNVLAGCEIHVRTPNALATSGNAKIAQVKGGNEKGTAFITHVNGQQVLSEHIGHAASVTIEPGSTKLTILCILDGRAMVGHLHPFDAVGDGIGIVSGLAGGVISKIRLNADIKQNSQYELHCEPIGDYRARAWLVEL